MPYYINYCFQKLVYDEKTIVGEFSAPEQNIQCCFAYDRQTEECTIWDNNRPADEILPLPLPWLRWKLEKNGQLKEKESKISY